MITIIVFIAAFMFLKQPLDWLPKGTENVPAVILGAVYITSVYGLAAAMLTQLVMR